MQIISIIDFGDTPVFEATTYPAVVVLRKNQSNDYKFGYIKTTDLTGFNDVDKVQIFPKDYLKQQIWSFANDNLAKIWEKIQIDSIKLKQYINNQFFRGVVTGLNEAFLITEKQRESILKINPEASEIIKPYLRGKDVKRWSSEICTYIIYTYHGIDISKFPAIKEYLLKYKDMLEKRATSKNHKWYELQQPQTGIYQHYEKTKIISTDIAKRSEFTIDTTGAYIDATIFCIPLNDLFLLALLNSNLLELFYKSISSVIRGNFLRFKKIYLDLLPIKVLPEDKQIPFVELVEKILDITKSSDYLDNSKISSQVIEYEAKINQMVYELYGLSPEEVSIIENSTNEQ